VGQQRDQDDPGNECEQAYRHEQALLERVDPGGLVCRLVGGLTQLVHALAANAGTGPAPGARGDQVTTNVAAELFQFSSVFPPGV
jgi:hypothetical protein